MLIVLRLAFDVLEPCDLEEEFDLEEACEGDVCEAPLRLDILAALDLADRDVSRIADTSETVEAGESDQWLSIWLGRCPGGLP